MASPVTSGANVAVKVALLPAFNVRGSATPPIVKPVPDTLSWEIVMGDVPEFVIVKLSLLVAPTTTLPKVRTEGLALSEPEGAVAESAVEVGESPFALVTPEHPDTIAAESKSVADITRVGARAVGDACHPVTERRKLEFFAPAIKTRGVYGGHAIRLYCSSE